MCEGIVDCIVAQGKVKTREEAYRQVWMLDQHGLLGNSAIAAGDPTRVVQGPERAKYSLDERQLRYVKRDMADRLSLEQVVEQVKPTILLGLTGIPGVFTEKAIRTMAQYQEKPVIFPLSNPDSHAECTAEQAFKWTDGRAIFASGSPFNDVTLPNGKIGRTNQCNNSYSFPVSATFVNYNYKKMLISSTNIGIGIGRGYFTGFKCNFRNVLGDCKSHCRYGYTLSTQGRHFIPWRHSFT